MREPVNYRLLAMHLTKLGWKKNKFPGAMDKACEALSKDNTYAQAAQFAMDWAIRTYGKNGVVK